MIVVDANVIAGSMCLDDDIGAAARAALIVDPEWLAPDHCRIETANTIRNLTLRRAVEPTVSSRAITALAKLEIMLVPTMTLLPRIWQLRDNLAAYDAAYVALAELFDLDLLTADRRLARAPGIRCRIVHP